MGKTITIDGTTYNNIESVSVNGNVFGEGSSEYTEEVLRRDFSPNGQAFYDTVSINLARGDYIEAKFDITNQPNSRVCFAVGTDITVWPTSSHPSDTTAVYTSAQDVNYYGISYMHCDSSMQSQARSTNRTISYGTNEIKIRIDAAGIWVNDVYLKHSEYQDLNENGNGIYPVMYALLDASNIQVGAAQSENEYSYAYYDYIKVCRKITS